ncbi:MAG: hypothetical protein RL754_1213 [Bacteroidota bacterium]|jgi:hypothetical protein
MVWTVIIASTLLGAAASWSVQTSSDAFKYLLAFSGAFLFGMLFTHLIPEVFQSRLPHIGWWILAGFGVQLLLDYLSKGLEHGHLHLHENTLPLLPILGLLLHSFFEGMPLGEGQNHHDHLHHTNPGLLWSVALHKFPIAILVTSALRKARLSAPLIAGAVILFAISAPLGHEAAQWVMTSVESEARILAFTIGLLIHVSTTILFESAANHQFNLLKLLFVALGIGLSAFFM